MGWYSNDNIHKELLWGLPFSVLEIEKSIDEYTKNLEHSKNDRLICSLRNLTPENKKENIEKLSNFRKLDTDLYGHHIYSSPNFSFFDEFYEINMSIIEDPSLQSFCKIGKLKFNSKLSINIDKDKQIDIFIESINYFYRKEGYLGVNIEELINNEKDIKFSEIIPYIYPVKISENLWVSERCEMNIEFKRATIEKIGYPSSEYKIKKKIRNKKSKSKKKSMLRTSKSRLRKH